MKRVVLVSVVLLGVLASSSTFAQQPAVAGQGPWPATSNYQLPATSLTLGEPTGPSALSPWIASTPMRLSLQGPIFPMAGAFPNCAAYEDPSGNSVQGFAVQRYTMLRLTPNLVLHGFSSAGCPIDSAIGAALTFTVPVAPSLFLVAGAGVYGVPSHYPLPARQNADFRVDLVKAMTDGRSMSVGVGRRGVSFGGTF
jgi:hypothetical protein